MTTKSRLLSTTAAPPAPPPPPPAPPTPDLSQLPVNVDRKTAADLVTHYFFQISPRTLERWPVPAVVVNGKAMSPTAAILAHAQLVMEAAQARGSRSTERAA
ncbi:hypothetical protein [Belnapia sp. F-4-1]|uniref:hypothetical protein n=1 Tax=Belnapia sp. F-4-1 TaxID=1545443 RepID=UPI0005BDC249|nr:hypothetical protein [Belnapia sp. F-4-1]